MAAGPVTTNMYQPERGRGKISYNSPNLCTIGNLHFWRALVLWEPKTAKACSLQKPTLVTAALSSS